MEGKDWLMELSLRLEVGVTAGVLVEELLSLKINKLKIFIKNYRKD